MAARSSASKTLDCILETNRHIACAVGKTKQLLSDGIPGDLSKSINDLCDWVRTDHTEISDSDVS